MGELSTVEMWTMWNFHRDRGHGRGIIGMDRLMLMKIFSEYEEFSEGDFTPEELEEYLIYREGTPTPLSPYAWKAQYFEFYDDVKDKSLKKQDW